MLSNNIDSTIKKYSIVWFFRKIVRLIVSKCLLQAELRNNYTIFKYVMKIPLPAWVYHSKAISPQIANLTHRHKKKFYDDYMNGVFSSKLSINYALLKIQSISDIQDSCFEIKDTYPYSFYIPEIISEPKNTELYSVQIPKMTVSIVKNVRTLGAFQLTKDGSLILYDPNAEPSDKAFVAGVWRYFHVLQNNPKIIYTTCLSWPAEKMKDGILISGRASVNYFHWLIEDMTKLYNLESINIDKSVPLIIEKSLPKQFIEILKILTDRPYIQVDSSSTSLYIEKLYIPSICTNIADDFSNPYWTTAGVSYEHLSYVRKKVFEKLNLEINHSVETSNRKKTKIYLSRKNFNNRSLLNTDEVESFIKDFDFEIVYPETMSFVEQVKMFNSADVILGPGGAAFANVIFCKPNTKVGMIISERNKEYCLYSNLTSFAHSQLINIPGPNQYPASHFSTPDEFAHSSYYGSIEKIKIFIEKYAQN